MRPHGVSGPQAALLPHHVALSARQRSHGSSHWPTGPPVSAAMIVLRHHLRTGTKSLNNTHNVAAAEQAATIQCWYQEANMTVATPIPTITQRCIRRLLRPKQESTAPTLSRNDR